ncbi:MAG: 3-methylitaconate isomerase [Acidaminococcus provencensis]|jgi:2-methylaconitate cis-trans-isomerase PrpF|uniref:2-methylaconitate cis-trans isomerase PrpF family protein n=1 Tax=Acidaminococcus TaxID=904 RepID=UPI000CF9DBB6|nr:MULTISPECIES: PrpF domain-containing protein [Acidaminococcus]MCH4096910.1 3-methylitaconate isomerase [Acidaminococcus provencensis]RHK03800.1 3-methylitaconate isomerase [Acidaminococcus sp. AM05-11]
MNQEQRKFPCVYMRGGTSKAVFFHKEDLPQEEREWPEIFLKVMGTPDVKQIDGMGGTVSSTSKVAVIAKSQRPGVDVDYHFFQVDIVIPRVDDSANCGNISSAVGPYAIDEGLVPAVEPITVVRVYNENTKKVIEEHVRVQNGHACVNGDTVIQGVPGTGSRVDLFFEDPAGAKTGKLFPTGQKKERLDVPGYGFCEVTLIDCSNPVVFIKAEDLGIKGTELTELNQNKDVMEHIERIRGLAAVRMGFITDYMKARTESTSAPKVAIISRPQDYKNMDGQLVPKETMDLCVRAISVGMLHKAYPMTVAVATGAAAKLPGTIVADCLGNFAGSCIRLGHSSGVTEVNMKMDGEKVLQGGVVRTARRIMDGWVYIR